MVQVAARNSTVDATTQKVCWSIAAQARTAGAHDQRPTMVSTSDVHAHQARREPGGRVPEQARRHGARDSRQQESGCPRRALSEFKSGRVAGIGRNRYRGARTRHRTAAARDQFRSAACAGGLRAPHRPHGPRGATGEAISLVCADDKPLLADIERVIRRQVPREIIAGFEPNPERARRADRAPARTGKRRRGQRDRPQRRSTTRPEPVARSGGARTGQPASTAGQPSSKPNGQPRAEGGHLMPSRSIRVTTRRFAPRRPDRQRVDRAHQHSRVAAAVASSRALVLRISNGGCDGGHPRSDQD